MSQALEKALARTHALGSLAMSQGYAMKKAGKIGDLFGSSDSGLGFLNSFQNQSATKARYQQFRGWVYAAVNALSMHAAKQSVFVGKREGVKGDRGEPKKQKMMDHRFGRAPQRVQMKAAKNELKVIEDHPLLQVLKRPNTIQHQWQFVYSFVANICLTGWGFVVGGVNDETGEYELYSLPTTWIVPDHSKGAFKEFKIVNPNNPTADVGGPTFDRTQVTFAYLPNPSNPLSALSPGMAQSNAIKIDDAIQSSQAQFFDNGIFPSMIVTMGKDPHPDVPGGIRPRLTGAQRRQVYAAIKKTCSGIANYGNPAIVDGMIEKFEKLSATQNEMGWEKSEKTVRSRILSGYGVHPFILGEEVPGSYAQMYIVQDTFYQRVNVFLDLLGTMLTEFAPNMKSRQEQKAKKEDKLEIWYEECQAKDPSMEKSLWEGARGRGDIGQNEFRAWMNLPPDEDKVEAAYDKGTLTALNTLAEKVTAGAITKEQGAAILKGLGIQEELATEIAGEGPPEPPPEEEGGAAAEGEDEFSDWGADSDEFGGFDDFADDTEEPGSALQEALKFVKSEWLHDTKVIDGIVIPPARIPFGGE